MAALSASLTISKTLHRLTFWSCDLDDHAVEQLSAGLKENTSLNGLDVSSNPRITDTGAKNLAIMLTENSTLNELCLSYNQAITDTGAVSLSAMIRENKSLRRLHLEGTSVGEKGAEALMESLLCNETLHELWLPSELHEYCMSHDTYDEVKNVVRF